MGKTEGTSTKRRKKMVDETDNDGVLLDQKHVVVHSNPGARVTRSKAAETRASSVIPINNDAATVHYRNQPVVAIAAISPSQTPDADVKPIRIAAAAARIRKIKGTKGVGSNPHKSIVANPCYPVRVKQQAEEFVDGNISYGNQGACPSRNSNLMSCTSLQNKVVDEFELYISRLFGEDDEPLTVPSSTQLVEQAQSSIFAPIFINVEGYNVKKEVAPMLQQIFDKHNDIARDCIIKNREVVVPILEVICSYCQKLQNTCLRDIVDAEVEDMASVVKNLQQMGLDVKWLIERLKKVSDMKRLMKHYPTLKEEKMKVVMKEKEVDVLKQKWSVAEAELATMKVHVDEKCHEFERQLMALKVRGLRFRDKSLLSGLI